MEKPRDLPPVKMDSLLAPERKNQVVIRVENITAKAGRRILWHDVSFSIRFGEKVGLIGPNGSGKTTLLKRILSGGEGITLAAAVRPGYFSQQLETLSPNDTVIETVRKTAVHPEPHIRTVLARLRFTGDDVYKRVGWLSGGERAKAALATLILSESDLLILDEPTSFLDIEAIEALEVLLKAFPGTVLFATHDRRLLENLATRVLEIAGQRVITYEGTYREYMEHKERREQGNPSPAEQELLQVEVKLAEVLGRLAENVPEERKIELEAQLERLLMQRRALRRDR